MTASRLFDQVSAELSRAEVPLSTYRLQLNHSMTFTRARDLVPYLARLGAGALYASPYLQALSGSMHGYDVVDHRSINREIGTEEDHTALAETLRRHRMGLIFDFVPNHMGVDRENELWWEVLENGPSSPVANFFDVDWAPVKQELESKVLLPVLGDQYGLVLERGELKLGYALGRFTISYYDRTFPVGPRAYRSVLSLELEKLIAELGPEHLDGIELQSIITALDHLPPRTTTDRPQKVERDRERRVIQRRLAELTERSPEVRAHVERNVEVFNGVVGEPASFDRLDALLDDCSYRLAHWRVAGDEINYRRFFDINSLAAIRVEDPEVFQHAHALVFDWIADGKVTGLRIDHPDGLFDPTGYFLALQEQHFIARARRLLAPEETAHWQKLEPELRWSFRAAVASSPSSPLRRSLYVVVEKIQGGLERIPSDWAVNGTTGYRFAALATGLLVDRRGEDAMSTLYHRFIGRAADFAQLVYEKKRLVLRESLASELNVLAHALNRISEMNRRTRDFTLNSLRRALAEYLALLPVYRTYLDARNEPDPRDVQYVERTINRAIELDPSTNSSIYEFLKDVVLGRLTGQASPDERAVMKQFTMKLQQVSGPVTAKGVEDTAFFLYNRLLALNEVGGEPGAFGVDPKVLHELNDERARLWHGNLLTTSTHDTKRSEDVRARLCVLSELPDEWGEAVEEWAGLNERHKGLLGEVLAPDRNDEYHFYQAVVGAWPMGGTLADEALDAFRLRLREYMLKVVREAKQHTSWINTNRAYEAALLRFVDTCLSREHSATFLDACERFVRSILTAGQLNSLSTLTLKLASPGVPDFYQGNELWDLSLVDPDNRRPVDFDLRRRMLDELDEAIASSPRPQLCRRLLEHPTDGAIKLFVTSQGLRLRWRLPELFRTGSYLPLSAHGPAAEHVTAFARRSEGDWLVAVAPRVLARASRSPRGIAQLFAKTSLVLPPELRGERLTDTFTLEQHSDAVNGGLELAGLLGTFPVALLVRTAESAGR